MSGAEDDDFGDIGQAQAFQRPREQGNAEHGQQALDNDRYKR